MHAFLSQTMFLKYFVSLPGLLLDLQHLFPDLDRVPRALERQHPVDAKAILGDGLFHRSNYWKLLSFPLFFVSSWSFFLSLQLVDSFFVFIWEARARKIT